MNLRALLELCRVSNLPTVWSNCLVGYFAGVTTFQLAFSEKWDRPNPNRIDAADLIKTMRDAPLDWVQLLLFLCAPFSLLYVGGMILNDYLDRRIDAQERPNRPIPSGRVKAGHALGLSLTCFAIGIIGIWLFEQRTIKLDHSPWRSTALGLVLLVAIVMYNVTHTRSARSVLLMGACRALIVLSVAAAYHPPVMRDWWFLYVAGPALTLLFYTIAISLVARREVEHAGRQRRFGGPKTVMNMIAAMPLLDAAWLLAMGLWPASLFCVACAGMTKLAHRRVAGS